MTMPHITKGYLLANDPPNYNYITNSLKMRRDTQPIWLLKSFLLTNNNSTKIICKVDQSFVYNP